MERELGLQHNIGISHGTNLYTIVLSVLVLISVLQRNVFFLNSPAFSGISNYIELLTYVILLVLIIEKKYPVKVLVISALLGALLFIGYVKSGMAVFFRSLLLILAARNIKYEKIIKTMLCSISAGIIISLVLYIAGLAPDSVSKWHFEGYGFGFGGGNGIGELLCVINMMICYLKIRKGYKLNYLFEILLALIIYIVTTSKTATVIFAATPFAMVLFINIFRKKNTRIMRLLVYAVNPLLFVFSYVTARLYTTNAFVQKLDLILTNRFFLNSYAISKYPLSLFGQKVFLHDTGVYNSVRGIGNITVTVDSSYVLALVSLGLIPIMIFVAGYFLVVRRAFKEQDYSLAAIAVLICIYGFTEVKSLEVYDNFVYLSLVASYIPQVSNAYANRPGLLQRMCRLRVS